MDLLKHQNGGAHLSGCGCAPSFEPLIPANNEDTVKAAGLMLSYNQLFWQTVRLHATACFDALYAGGRNYCQKKVETKLVHVPPGRVTSININASC